MLISPFSLNYFTRVEHPARNPDSHWPRIQETSEIILQLAFVNQADQQGLNPTNSDEDGFLLIVSCGFYASRPGPAHRCHWSFPGFRFQQRSDDQCSKGYEQGELCPSFPHNVFTASFGQRCQNLISVKLLTGCFYCIHPMFDVRQPREDGHARRRHFLVSSSMHHHIFQSLEEGSSTEQSH